MVKIHIDLWACIINITFCFKVHQMTLQMDQWTIKKRKLKLIWFIIRIICI